MASTVFARGKLIKKQALQEEGKVKVLLLDLKIAEPVYRKGKVTTTTFTVRVRVVGEEADLYNRILIEKSYVIVEGSLSFNSKPKRLHKEAYLITSIIPTHDITKDALVQAAKLQKVHEKIIK